MKRLIKRMVSMTPYRVVRAGHANRFQAISETLGCLKQRGYAPRHIIDGGANVGSFAIDARRVFGTKCFISLFEPQPACQPALAAFADQSTYKVYPAALGSVHGETLRLVIDSVSVTTGAHISTGVADNQAMAIVPVVSLDRVFSDVLSVDDRALLKLDLQGWELEALKGGVSVLSRVEVVLLEVSFFAQAYEPSIATVVGFLGNAGFDIYDVAAVTARQRDNRAHQADLIFVARWSTLLRDSAWS